MAKKAPGEYTAEDLVSFITRKVAKKDKEGKVVLDKDGNPETVDEAIKADEVMAQADYEDRVVVVTTSGEKLSCEKSAPAYKKWAGASK